MQNAYIIRENKWKMMAKKAGLFAALQTAIINPAKYTGKIRR